MPPGDDEGAAQLVVKAFGTGGHVRKVAVGLGFSERTNLGGSARCIAVWYRLRMANSEHLAILKEGGHVWNQWRWNNLGVVPDLTGADLSKVVLLGTNLQGANLSGACLRDAELRVANLTDADLGAVDLRGTRLVRSDLRHAYLGNAVLQWTVFADSDLTSADGLESCLHQGPSSVGIDTVYKSGGTIPEIFLRGCGVPEPFILYVRSLVAQPIEFYSCFISYSSHDHAFAERLHADLVAKGLRCWFAPEDLKIGDRFQERIEESIQVFDKVMIVLSEASVKSAWVEREVNAARDREAREQRTVLFPIRIDDAVMDAKQAWAADIRRSRHIGDFREWETHSSYVKALDRLLRDLRPSKEARSEEEA